MKHQQTWVRAPSATARCWRGRGCVSFRPLWHHSGRWLLQCCELCSQSIALCKPFCNVQFSRTTPLVPRYCVAHQIDRLLHIGLGRFQVRHLYFQRRYSVGLCFTFRAIVLHTANQFSVVHINYLVGVVSRHHQNHMAHHDRTHGNSREGVIGLTGQPMMQPRSRRTCMVGVDHSWSFSKHFTPSCVTIVLVTTFGIAKTLGDSDLQMLVAPVANTVCNRADWPLAGFQ